MEEPEGVKLIIREEREEGKEGEREVEVAGGKETVPAKQ